MNPKIAKLIMSYKEDKEEEALLALWESFQPLVYSSMRKFYVAMSEQENISQEAFIQLLLCANKYDPSLNVPFESFYKMNLHYWFLGQINKKKELLVVDQDWQNGFSMADLEQSTIGNAQEATQLSELQMILAKALETLTEKQRQVVVLFYLKNVKLVDIAKGMGCSYKVAYKHKDAGIKKIRKQMSLVHWVAHR